MPRQRNEQACPSFRNLWKLVTSPASSCTPTVELPSTSPSRLTSTSDEKTILYLAYGSNLSAETFKGNRGIRPLSAVNVHVPSLNLTFDLAGIPYIEPCFANTQYHTPPPSSKPTTSISSPDYHKNRWTKGLIGVVYEVTPEDYRTIIATEGGGASYHDVIVPCYALPKGTKMVDTTPSGVPFMAHTLLSPRASDPASNQNTGNGGVKKKDGITRPDPSYAQPSARYLKLITDGGEEHSLPGEYMAYLYNIRPYTITTRKQRAGQALFLAIWMPIVMAVIVFSKVLADEDGRVPAWWVSVMSLMFRGVWGSYDMVFKKVFGDGERTIYDDGDGDDEKEVGKVWGCRRGCVRLENYDEKKMSR
ncbi:hypothetical protein L207DRAFT_428551 [Hyaloscypha variabilis F]|uniref:gamma-glutamylcyclotransferase n=1 Tax=Hyaloscypha variabilis (strain UAMH 11265 / GT02V1 / F) TaxID=1149755 RepID=A0A2J6RM43_HYAVF|nr:hypothetical protein L207DRAFT_428551 [Hyaloscypha variabilis F]